MTGSMLGIRGWIMRLWHSRLRRKWRKLRAGTLRRLGLLPPASGPSPGQIASAPVGVTGGLNSEPIFETNLQPNPETLSVWHDLLQGRPGGALPTHSTVGLVDRKPTTTSR